MAAPEVIHSLVARFADNVAAYRAGTYNETQVRREFVDPFFEALGWDVANRQGYAEAYKDVIHEDSIRIGGGTKAPDYCFRIGGTRKFFLETKKPSVNLKTDTHPAYQLRRYAWSAKLPVSVLTDFEEFAVYDCRLRPNPNDPAATARIMYLTCREYPGHWDEIAGIFSREAILKGSFDKYAEGTKGKRGTASVDDAFLEEIEAWRDALARNLALRNPQLSIHELNFAVQVIIDRIVFLRICEDRKIEPYGRLQAVGNGAQVYPRLCELFRRADERYNSGLFHFGAEKERSSSPDTLTPGLVVDDGVLKDMLRRLYYPDSPYEFSVLPADILGQVYERFLGKVIRLTAGHQAKIEDKPEVRKAGGVYYTPTYIVEYIVRNTVGKLVEGRKPKDVAALRVLDPACGSGSFLLGAYQFLLDWHRDWYVADGPEKHAKGARAKLYQGHGGEWKLTTAERRRILLDNIYGVDIDPQAVEVTKLSLLLKVLEGESDQSLSSQMLLFRERALPDIGGNIKCGNSLIGPDFYTDQQLELFDDEARYRINAFDWQAEFPAVFAAGGFDAVIGNPPYVRQESLSEFKAYFATHYEAFDGVADLYAYFLEKGVRLLRDGGLFSVIVSSSFLRATYGGALRRTLRKHAAIVRLVDFGGLAVFANAKDTYVCIPLLAKGVEQRQIEVAKVSSLVIGDLTRFVAGNHFTVPPERFSPDAWALKSDAEAAVFAKIVRAGKPLGEFVERKFFRGILTGLNEAFEVTTSQGTALAQSSSACGALIKSFLGGQDVRRYRVEDAGRHLIVIPAGWTRQQIVKASNDPADFSERGAWNWFSREYPGIAEHLTPFADRLRERQDQGDYWWELRPCAYYAYFDAPKIIFPDICKGPRFYLDTAGRYLANTAYCLGTGDLYLLGMLNSRLFWFAIGNISIPFGIRAGEYRYRLIYQYMEQVPIRVIDFANPADTARHDRMVQLVESMLALHQQLAAAKTDPDRVRLARQIAATDHEIDRLVYDLYGLTEEEIRIVEQR
jgi:hypothetical protein